jgi:NTE family protein
MPHDDPMTRALVLGGGGPVGVAWETGVIAGLAEAGVDLTTADRIVGTSAGSIVGAHLALGEDREELLRAAKDRSTRGPAIAIDQEAMVPIGEAIAQAMAGTLPKEELAAQLGELARSAETIPEEVVLSAISPDLGQDWPDRDFACTAVDVDTGELKVWDRPAGAPLDRAVASSCAVPGIFPPITIGGRRYMDGGVISPSNAGLAAGHDVVVVLSVITRVVPEMADFLRGTLEPEVAELRAGGATVEVIEFDDACAGLANGQLMDFTLGVPMLDVATAQGKAEAERIGAVWG